MKSGSTRAAAAGKPAAEGIAEPEEELAVKENAAQEETPAPEGMAEREEELEWEICPACGSKLVKRVAKRGANAGKEFMGCSNYPACRYTREIEKKE